MVRGIFEALNAFVSFLFAQFFNASFLFLGVSPYFIFQCSVVRRFLLLKQMFLLALVCVGPCCSFASVDPDFVGS